MSSFQNITHGFNNLGIGGGKRDEPQQGQRYYGYQGPGQGGFPPAQYYGAPPTPAYQPPSVMPPLPPGWTTLFDQQYQRWYYVEQATGRTQWEAPGYVQPPPPVVSRPGNEPLAYGQGGQGGQGSQDDEEDKGRGTGGMLLGAAGGLAVGAIGGALIQHALSESDSDEERRQLPALYPQASYSADEPPAVLPATDADGDSVSSSDREAVQEARARYEDALAAAADSDAGSSEEEELGEARQEYYEEYEETYGRDDDD
ncbi:hypothetical protein TOPH_06217 [Tolypocladium ophioglossoides CBS 100239]|uniref:WW domain-containing protein n=1 Tax=Tolypocladium ophioglossoides (strain CBS 100239) TaxID=1163406 RepID=A0A0L0N548_TOLOC|nr:hypothetical protein TOPH_06217 [Tolypocladium ophioglossoides CBS 100239]